MTIAGILLASAPAAGMASGRLGPHLGPAVHVGGISATTSVNWSGYVANAAKPLTYVEAKWTEPSYACDGASPESAVVWVGLDGWYDDTVEQGGTFDECSGTNQGLHYAWWEMYPTNYITTMFVVNVGDKMFAQVVYTPGIPLPYNIEVVDKTTGQSFSVNEQCASNLVCNRSSAEWIVETPEFGNQYAYLPDFATPIGLSYGFASVRPGPKPSKVSAISVFPNFSVTMVGASGDRAVPSVLGPQGRGFTDQWMSSAP